MSKVQTKSQLAAQATKQLILWADHKTLAPEWLESWDDMEWIEVQSPVLALQFLQAHPVAIFVGSSSFGIEFWKQVSAWSSQFISVLLLEESDLPQLPRFLNVVPELSVLPKPMSFDDLAKTVNAARLHLAKKNERRQLQRESSKKYRELEALNAGLEKIVEERTRHIEIAKIEEEEKLNKARSLIRFIKDLAATSAFDDLLEVLRREVRKFGKVGDPILFLNRKNEKMILYSHQSGQYLRSETSVIPAEIQNDQLSQAVIQKFLANHFGRPFGKLLVTTLEMQSQTSAEYQVHICIEIFLPEPQSQKVLEFLMERIEPISITIDRFLLEQEHSENAFRWEQTFDSLARPIAIIDLEYEVLRSNKKFSDRSTKSICYEIFAQRTAPCEGCPMAQALTLAKPEYGTIQVKTAEGLRVFQVHSYPINLEGGRPTNVVNAYVDITQSRELYIRLLQSEKMGALGVLAGNIAHELNNPLTGIRSLTQVLIKEVDPHSPLAGDLIEIEKATERSQKIIRNLQDFSSKEGTPLEDFSLDEIVERTIPMLKSLLRSHRLEIDLSTDNRKVRGEPHLIQQVVFNLINNACQAMKTPGTLSISTEIIAEKKQLLLRIKDTGPGIPEDIQARVFEPFFTTKKEGLGTGLGLSLSREIIERHHGKIEFISSEGKGTEFFVQFPEVFV
jgi:signal transduction histidine kinase